MSRYDNSDTLGHLRAKSHGIQEVGKGLAVSCQQSAYIDTHYTNLAVLRSVE